MALDYTNLNALTQDYIRPQLQDNIFNKYPILQRLRKKLDMNQRGGTFITQPIIYAKKTSKGTYSGWDTLLTAVNDSFTGVTYNWGHYYCNMGISYTDELKNAGKAKVISLLDSERKTAETTLADKMTTDIFAATSVTNGIQGFPLMLDDSSTDYAGINIGDFSGWAASIDSTSTTMTIGLLQGKFSDCSDGNETPTLIVSNYDTYDKYYLLLEPKPEFRVQKENYSLKFQGADWIIDKACPGSGSGTADNDIEFINENFIQFYVHPDDNFKVHPWLNPVNQQGRITRVTWSGQLGTNNRRRHGALEAINPAL
jgi:hypothetical protein